LLFATGMTTCRRRHARPNDNGASAQSVRITSWRENRR
jgi:hypothetical protein